MGLGLKAFSKKKEAKKYLKKIFIPTNYEKTKQNTSADLRI